MGFWDKLSEVASNVHGALEEQAKKQAPKVRKRAEMAQEKLDSHDYEKLNDDQKEKYNSAQHRINKSKDWADCWG